MSSNTVAVDVDGRTLRLSNLDKVLYPEVGLTKSEIITYYTTVAPVLLPHLADRAMVMKRYPDGAASEPFFMKRAPSPRPEWIQTCAIAHASGNVIDFPMIQDLASLLWVINLGCIDLNPWYARCDDVDRPDYLHFDLDPGSGATFDHVRESGLILHEALEEIDDPPRGGCIFAAARREGSRDECEKRAIDQRVSVDKKESW